MAGSFRQLASNLRRQTEVRNALKMPPARCMALRLSIDAIEEHAMDEMLKHRGYYSPDECKSVREELDKLLELLKSMVDRT